MKKTLVDELNKVLTNTLDYNEVLQKLADAITHESTQNKLDEFAGVAIKESKRLMQIISDLGGDVQSTGRLTDQEAVYWVSRPMPDSQNMQSVLACLIEAERNKEDDYATILGNDEIDRETRNRLVRHRREAETNLKYFQSAMQTVEKKVEQ